MPIAGIICEYNPFHNGHAWQIQQLKTVYGMDAVVCAMSGNFLQRGEPALLPKLERARMALMAGADLVLELPALFATRSAYWFALGGLSLLSGVGVSHLAFGAESDDLAALQQTALQLAHPSPAFRTSLQNHLNQGLSFVAAQAAALKETSQQSQNFAFVPTLPNDRLALIYLQILEEKGYALQPLLLKRQGDAYHQAQPTKGTGFASATALRGLLQPYPKETTNGTQSPSLEKRLGVLKPFLPASSYEILCNQGQQLVFNTALNPLLLPLLRRATLEELRQLPDMTEGLEHRIYRCARQAVNLEDFYNLLKTKRYSLTRLQRTLTHLYLNYSLRLTPYLGLGVPYLRVLGASTQGKNLLHQLKPNATLPIITGSGQLKKLCYHDPACSLAWELEVRSGELYALLQNNPTLGSPEYALRPIF